MHLFSIIENKYAILRSRGVFKQSLLYSRGRDVYAKWGSGFVQLRGAGVTTHPDVRWEEMDTDTQLGLYRAGGKFDAPYYAPRPEAVRAA